MFKTEEINTAKETILNAYSNVARSTVDFAKALERATAQMNAAGSKGDGVEYGLSLGMTLGGLKVKAEHYGAALEVERARIADSATKMVNSAVAYYLMTFACGTPDQEALNSVHQFRDASRLYIEQVTSIYDLLVQLPNKEQIKDGLGKIQAFFTGIQQIIALTDQQLARVQGVSFEAA